MWSFLAATILPIGSEPFLAGVVRSSEVFSTPVIVATLGNTLGALTLYWMGRRAGERFGEKVRATSSGARAEKLFKRFGKPALIFSWVPVVGDVLVGLAGAAGIGLGGFALWLVTGKAARYGFVAWVALQV